MNFLLLLSLISFFLSVILTPISRKVLRGMGVVDHPDGTRKFHQYPIARMGGVAIALAYAGTFAILLLSPFASRVSEHIPFVLKLAPAGLLIFATGVLDDVLRLKPTQKLLGQSAAACYAYWAGVRLMGSPEEPMHWWSFPLTVLWLVGCSNAFNLIDGLDGLAAGLGFFATVAMILAAVVHNIPELTLAAVPLAGCLLGFLIFNFHPASIFLGDSGSLLIGFLLGCYGIQWERSAAALELTAPMLAPLMAVAVPLLDVCLSIARRLIRRKPVFSADRGHIHHRLLDRGLKPRGVSVVLYMAAAAAAAFALLQTWINTGYASHLIVFLFCIAVVVGVRALKYVEFGIAGDILSGREFAAALNARLILDGFRTSMRIAGDIPTQRKLVEDACRELGFSRVTMTLEGVFSEHRISEASEQGQYEIVVPLAGSDHVTLTRDFFSTVHPTVLSLFVDALRTQLHPCKVMVARAGAGVQNDPLRAVQ